MLTHIKDYKIARAKSFGTLSLSSSKIEENKIFNTTRSKSAKFETQVDEMLDSQEFANVVEKILENLKETFTKIEKKYYELCLFSDYSEEYFRTNFTGGLSKNGLAPIKNSCILKIALAFNIEVYKWLVK